LRRDHWIALVVGALILQGVLTPAYLAYRLPPYSEARRQGKAFAATVGKLEEVRRNLGEQRSIGYLCEGRIDPARPDQMLARYYFAQSWLAPTLVGPELDRELSLAYFVNSANLTRSLDTLRLRIIHSVAPNLALVTGRER